MTAGDFANKDLKSNYQIRNFENRKDRQKN